MFTHINIAEPVDVKVINGPKGRFYVSPTTGEKYPSITTLLGLEEKQAVKDWRQSLGEDRAAKETKRAADRGSAVHTIIENYLNNHADPLVGIHPADDRVAIKMFNQMKLKLKNINNIYAQEIPLVSDTLGIAGRVDCIAEYNGKLAIIDFKSSTNDKSKGMIDDYFLQTTFYSLAFLEMYNIRVDEIVILMGSEKGIVPLVFTGLVEDYIEKLVERVNAYRPRLVS